MKVHFVFVALASTCLLAAFGFAQAYETGKILSIVKHTPETASGHTDAPLKASVDDYDVTISSGETFYTAVYHHNGGLDPAWTEERKYRCTSRAE